DDDGALGQTEAFEHALVDGAGDAHFAKLLAGHAEDRGFIEQGQRRIVVLAFGNEDATHDESPGGRIRDCGNDRVSQDMVWDKHLLEWPRDEKTLMSCERNWPLPQIGPRISADATL